MMKRVFGWIKEIAISLILLAIVLNIVSYLKSPNLNFQKLPEFSFVSTTGKDINSSMYRDKPLLLHFWATWCPTCKIEASNIQKLSKSYNILTIAINSGSDEEINFFMDDKELDFDVINDKDGQFAFQFEVANYPTTFIFDKDGIVKFSEVGYSSTLGLKLRMMLAN